MSIKDFTFWLHHENTPHFVDTCDNGEIESSIASIRALCPNAKVNTIRLTSKSAFIEVLRKV